METLTLDCWTKDWTKSFYLKLDSLNFNTLQALMLWLTNTTRQNYSNTLCFYKTHTNSLDTYVLTLHNSLWHTSPHTSLTSLTNLTPPHLFILGVCWLGNQLETSSIFFLNTLFTKLLDYSINMWLSFTST